MIIEMINADGIPVNVDPDTVSKVRESKRAAHSLIKVGTLEIELRGTVEEVSKALITASSSPAEPEPAPAPDVEPLAPAPDAGPSDGPEPMATAGADDLLLENP